MQFESKSSKFINAQPDLKNIHPKYDRILGVFRVYVFQVRLGGYLKKSNHHWLRLG
jgi:hypothetical protein